MKKLFISFLLLLGSLVANAQGATVFLNDIISTFQETNIEIQYKGGSASTFFTSDSRLTAAVIENAILEQFDMIGGYGWISLASVEIRYQTSNYTEGEIKFNILENKTSSNREINFRPRIGNVLKIKQLAAVSVLKKFNISVNCNLIFPGKLCAITLSGSETGVSYQLRSNFDNTLLQTLPGTGSPLTFRCYCYDDTYSVFAVKEGSTVEMNNRVSVIYYKYIDNLVTGETVLDKYLDNQGGQLIVNNPEMINLLNIAGIEDMIMDWNTNESEYKYPGMKVEISAGPELIFTYGPNFYPSYNKPAAKLYMRRCKSPYDNTPYDYIINMRYPGSNSEANMMLDIPIEGPIYQPNSTQFSLRLSASQYLVDYTLYRDGVAIKTTGGNASPLTFSNLGEKGTYTIKASYQGYTWQVGNPVIINNILKNYSYLKETQFLQDGGSLVSVTFFDGLGRAMQRYDLDAAGTGVDMLTPFEYNSIGREEKKYLPFVVSNEEKKYLPNFNSLHNTYYTNKFGTNHYAYAEVRYDNSVEDKIIEQSSPGEALKIDGGHTVKYGVRKNDASDNIKHYSLTGTQDVTCYGYYQPGEVVIKWETDQENARNEEIYDGSGKLIAKRSVTGSETRTTYTVFDGMGWQRYTIPPIQESTFSSGTKTLADLQAYCFYTEYDKSGRPYKQYIPGGGYCIILYDKLDRVVLTQRANQRAQNQWEFTKYDCLNRKVITGMCTGTEQQHQAALNTQTIFYETRGTALHGYTNTGYPVAVTSSDCLSVTYYDDYAWSGQSGVAYSSALAFEPTLNLRVTDRVTGSKIKVLGVSTDTWLLSGIYYDDKYNTVQTVSQLYPAGKEIVANKYNFTGQVTDIRMQQIAGALTTGYTKKLEYDYQGRVSEEKIQVAGDNANNQVTVAKYNYNDFGQLSEKLLHNGIETIHYSYDVSGRVIQSSSPGFSYEVGFDKTGGMADISPRYDGNISYVKWDRGGQANAYGFSYDNLKLLARSKLYTHNAAGWTGTDKFKEAIPSYDLNGNILQLSRTDMNGNNLHAIQMTYDGNRLKNMTVNGNVSAEYQYDASGNMTFDARRGVNIGYNILNLPQKIQAGAESISYIYSAAGEKLATQAGSTTTYYRGPLTYSGNDLLSIHFSEGVINKSAGGYIYYYTKSDHTGNIRALCHAANNLMITDQSTDYYPFGLAHVYENLNLNRYLYSNKELQDMSINGGILELYDFGARFYDPLSGRWANTDPGLQLINPYLFCGNNPAMFVDPDGEFFFGFFAGFLRGILKWENPFKEGWKAGVNEVKIHLGLFKPSKSQNFIKKVGEIVSRFTWQLPQTVLGYGLSQFVNHTSSTEVDYYDGTTTVSSGWFRGTKAIALGNFINGSDKLKADPDNAPFQHEYGHYLQSRKLGLAYLPKVGIPSLLSAGSGHKHRYYTVEQDANARAISYFNKRGVLNDWDFYKFPIGNKQWNISDIYKGNTKEFTDEFSTALDNARTRSTIWDFVSMFTPVTAVVQGVINHRHHVWVNETSK